MTRGRRKDLSIPPSRALLQQRDYRARKARYVADLEDRVRRVEEENARLKEEVDVLNAQLHAAGRSAVQRTSPSPEVVCPYLLRGVCVVISLKFTVLLLFVFSSTGCSDLRFNAEPLSSRILHCPISARRLPPPSGALF